METDFRLIGSKQIQLAQIISPNETIAIITMNISIGQVEGMVNICIPHMVIEPVIDQLSTKYWFSSMLERSTDNDKTTILAKSQRMLL